jgi:hypothetical protein
MSISATSSKKRRLMCEPGSGRSRFTRQLCPRAIGTQTTRLAPQSVEAFVENGVLVMYPVLLIGLGNRSPDRCSFSVACGTTLTHVVHHISSDIFVPPLYSTANPSHIKIFPNRLVLRMEIDFCSQRSSVLVVNAARTWLYTSFHNTPLNSALDKSLL